MDLNTLWFILIAVLFIGYFFLEGFDFGVGILMPFVGKDDVDRRVVINTIGPYWDANEVWLITAGGAMFAAFPHWYATLFSGFYLALFLMLIALILRAVGFEFRGKMSAGWWKKTADQFIFWGSLVPALLWGVALTNIVMGLPIDADRNFTGSFFSLLNPYALFGGVASVLIFTLHGAIFLSLRTFGAMRERVNKLARRLWLPVGIAALSFAVIGFRTTLLFDEIGIIPGTLPMLTIMTYIAIYVFLCLDQDGWAFASSGLTIVLGTVVAFEGLYPNVMPSTTDPAFHLTIYNASSSSYTLTVMTLVAGLFVPVVLAYQAWSYWVFRKRVTRESIPNH